MKSVGRPIINALRGRLYSAQAAAKESSEGARLARQPPQVTKLGNGMTVASVENYSPVTRVSVVVNTGARDETYNDLGITHCLRNAAQLTTEHASAFKIANQLQQIGANLTCTTNREQLFYTVECNRDNLDEAMDLLRCVTTEQSFFPWELNDAVPRLQLDLATLAEQPNVVMLEALHKAAYRDTLGRSMFTPAFKLGKHSPDMLKDFVRKQFVGSNFAVTAVGVDHEKLLRTTKSFTFESTNSLAPRFKSLYYGGQERIDTNSNLAYVAIAGEGASNGKEALALGVLQRVVGTGARVKYGNDVSPLSKATAQATNNPYAVSSFNASYSDSGLFGFVAAIAPNDADKVLKALVSQMKGLGQNISDADLQTAKSQLKAALLMELENAGSVLENMGSQVLNTGNVETDVAQQVDKITLQDVQAVAQKVLSKPPSMAAVGNLVKTPYLDELL